MTLNGATEITESRAVRILERNLRWIRPDAAGNTKSVLRHLLIRSGVLRQTTGPVDFEHSTFRDFFAASGLVHGDHFGFLVNHAHDPHYEDIVRMALAQCDPAEAESYCWSSSNEETTNRNTARGSTCWRRRPSSTRRRPTQDPQGSPPPDQGTRSSPRRRSC
jgi:hypothetical protein